MPVTSLANDAANGDYSVMPVPTSDPSVTAKGYFVYRLQPDGSIRGAIMVRNTGNAPTTVVLAVSDADTAQRGGSAFSPVGTKPTGVGTWVRLAHESVTLAPGKQRSVGFSVRVPHDVRPGQYLAGIASYVPSISSGGSQRGSDQAGAGVQVQTRQVIAVQVDVPGTWTPSLSIADVSLSRDAASIGIRMENTGDAFLQPMGSITVTDPTGTRVLSQPVRMGTFITDTEVNYPVAWPGEHSPGVYPVKVSVSYGGDQVARYGGVLEIKPPTTAAGGSAGTTRLGADTASGEGQDANQMLRGIEPWMVYGLGMLLLLIILLLALSLLQGRSRSRA
jgi:hypothetical protein